MDHIISSPPERLAPPLSKRQAERHACLGAVGVNRLAPPDMDNVRLLVRSVDSGGDDVNVMSATARLASKKMNVFADSAEMRIVVLGDESDSERSREQRWRQRVTRRGRKRHCPRQVVSSYRGRHERRLVVLSAREMENRRHNRVPYHDKV